MGTFLGILLLLVLIAFATFQIVGIVRSYKEKKKSKIKDKDGVDN